MTSTSGSSTPQDPAAAPAAGSHSSAVYVADADARVRENVRRLLAGIGADVRTCGDGAGLLAQLAAGPPPTAIVADMQLPGLGGLELLRELAARGLKVPTILLTGEADVSTAVVAMRAGAIDYIEKPHIDRALLKHVSRLLHGSHGAG